MVSSVRLTVRLSPTRLRQWHLRLLGRLAKRPGTIVTVVWASGGATLPSAVPLLFALERLIYRLADARISDAALPGDFAPFTTALPLAADLVIDLSATDPAAGEPAGDRTWRLTFDGVSDEAAAIGALAQGRTPVLGVVDAASGRQIVSGHPGTENKHSIVLAFEDVLARAATLITAALDGAATRYGGSLSPAVSAGPLTISRFALRSLSNAIARRLYRLCYQAPHWRVGWRFVDGPDVIDLRALPDRGWHDLADDGRRFYADPFPAIQDGRMYLFLEDFAHRLGRAVISAVEFGPRGPVGMPRPVLDTGSHASYPFVFQYQDQTWMVPETCSTATVDLYRSSAFPDRWVREATLLSGIVASDATLFEHGRRWWMLATVQGGAGSHSDVLHAWSADTPLGPWRPHERNPILVDVASARPAGTVVIRAGRIIRPVQNCTDGYGAALGLAEIIRLDDETFEQRVDAVLRPGRGWPGRRLHTLNRVGRLECIDGSRSLRKF
ncbi:MAG TPA: formyl transferase [Xanthobacteraceae bacterium]|nr:formyl transferase [Xanthobacteraceae bacterium]